MRVVETQLQSNFAELVDMPINCGIVHCVEFVGGTSFNLVGACLIKTDQESN